LGKVDCITTFKYGSICYYYYGIYRYLTKKEDWKIFLRLSSEKEAKELLKLGEEK